MSRKLAIFTLVLSLTIFISKNIQRIINTEIEQIVPNIDYISKDISAPKLIRSFKSLNLYQRNRECGYNKSICTHIDDIIENLEISEIKGYYFLSYKNT